MKLYDAIATHDYSEGTCFLCGARFQPGEGSREHVFPRWLLHHFDLWDTSVTLLNGTNIPYRNLCIPCCKTCNNDHLAIIEREVQTCFLAGPTAVAGMDRSKLMIWTLKIFFGLLYRELFLPLDRKNPDVGSIIAPDDMEQFQLLHYILQSCRVPMRFNLMDSDIPASLFVFEVQEPRNPRLRFDYKDDIQHRALYLRMGSVGILVSFDMGAQAVPGGDFFSHFQKLPLHPIQFAELGANLFIKARSLDRVPKVILSESPRGITFDVLSIAGFSMLPVFRDWSIDEMADMLVFFLGFPLEMVMPVSGKRATWLKNVDGSPKFMDINELPPWSDDKA